MPINNAISKHIQRLGVTNAANKMRMEGIRQVNFYWDENTLNTHIPMSEIIPKDVFVDIDNNDRSGDFDFIHNIKPFSTTYTQNTIFGI